MFRGILTKIFGLLLAFNVALWVFVIFTDNTFIVELGEKKNSLAKRVHLVASIVEPLVAEGYPEDFNEYREFHDRISSLPSTYTENLTIFLPREKFAATSLGGIYFDGNYSTMGGPITETLIPEQPLFVDDVIDRFNPLFLAYDAYRLVFQGKVITRSIGKGYVEKITHSHVIPTSEGRYELRYIKPVIIDDEVSLLIEAYDYYSLKDAYIEHNRERLFVLMGISALSLIFGVTLAISVAFPLKRLARRVGKSVDKHAVAEGLSSFHIKGYGDKKDEIGKLYRSIEDLTARLSKLFADKEAFAADVAHELKNPLASILANVSNISDACTGNDKEAIHAIKLQAHRMNQLISEISDAAIVDVELVKEKHVTVNLSEIATNIAVNMDEVAKGYGVTITSNIKDNMKLKGLSERLGQVVVNLLQNAMSFAGNGGTVSVRLQRKRRGIIVLTVEDTGPGIPKDVRETVFDRFFSSRSGTQKSNSGLGLYICKQIVEAHGGTIVASKSKRLGGALMTVELPTS